MSAKGRLLASSVLLVVALSLVCLAADNSGAGSTTRPSRRPAVGIRTIRDLQYVPDGDLSQRLDLYLPEQTPDYPLPLIIWIHGGGWAGGSKTGCPGEHLALKGYAVASIEYRFSQKALFPAQIQDCQAAIRYLRANAGKYHLDSDHFGVWGESAGGHLAALLGTTGGKDAFPPIGGNENQSDRVQAVCDVFGPADFTTVGRQAAEDRNVKSLFNFQVLANPYAQLIGVTLGEHEPKAQAASPVHYVSPDNPPILILHGTHDALVPLAQSQEFVEVLQKVGVQVMLQVMPGSGHGGPAFSKPQVQTLVHNFFDKHLKAADVKLQLIPEATVAVEPPAPPKPGK